MKEAKKKKSWRRWLQERYALVLRNEDNLQDTIPFRFTILQISSIGLLSITLVVALIAYASFQVFAYWERNHSTRGQWAHTLVQLASKTDSLDRELVQQSLYMKSVGAVLGNDTAYLQRTPQLFTAYNPTTYPNNAELNDPTIQNQPQNPNAYQNFTAAPIDYQTRKNDELLAESLNFYSPISGYVSDKFSTQERHYGIDLVAPPGTPIQAIADGTIIFSSWTQDGGYVMAIQHASNLLSIYKHNQRLLHEVGHYVRGGTPIAVLGNTGELTSGPHLHLELWYKGKAMNPQNLVSFH